MRIATIGMMLVMLAGCGLTTPKDEAVCLDMVKLVVTDPSSIQINSTKRTEGRSSLQELERLYRDSLDGQLSAAAQSLLDAYEKAGIEVSQVFVRLDLTYASRTGKVRDNVLCRYLNYDGNTELISFTIQNKDIYQNQFFEFFLMRERPKGLDINYRI